jgi:hypothetical protein
VGLCKQDSDKLQAKPRYTKVIACILSTPVIELYSICGIEETPANTNHMLGDYIMEPYGGYVNGDVDLMMPETAFLSPP